MPFPKSVTDLLEDVDVVVVGVAHGPARGVLLGLLRRGGVDEAAVAVGPLLVLVVALALQNLERMEIILRNDELWRDFCSQMALSILYSSYMFIIDLFD